MPTGIYKMSEKSRKNIALGHTGLKHSQETKDKIGIIHKGKKVSKETREKLRAFNLGRKLSIDTRRKISEANTKFNFITKTYLIKEYVKNRKTIKQIAKEINCSYSTIRNLLIKYRIKIRTRSEALKGINKDKNTGKDNYSYIDGRSLKEYYCECGKEISVASGFYHEGKCRSCSMIGKNIKYNITKSFLILEYVKNRKSIQRIAKIVGCSSNTVKNNLKKYNIKIRIVKRKKYYCIDCLERGIKKEISGYRAKRCRSCSGRKKINCHFKKGKDNIAYVDGKSKEFYPSEFNNQLRLKIRKRDNYTCQKCGITEEEHLMVYGQILGVHHIDYNKQNLKDDNLISLCRECNLRVNKNREYWKKHFQKKIHEKN